MSRLRRLSAALAAAVLLFSTQADVYASSHCAHHAAQAPAPAGGGHEHHGDQDTQSGQTDHSGACTCLGMCASSSVVVFDCAPAAAASFDATRDVVTRITTSDAVLPGFDHHLIPFATAPPVVS